MRELADFWSEDGDAISVYFQPPLASEMSHREEAIVAKDVLRQKLGALRRSSAVDPDDIERILDSITAMPSNENRSKIVFACARQQFWREYDIRGDFGVRVDVESGFSIAPLIAEQQGRRRYCIALADRNKARLLLLESRELTEHSHVLDEDKEKIRTTGARGSAHLERKNEEKVRQHFAFLADHLLHFHEHGDYDGLLIGCRDEMWPEIEAALHPDVKRVLLGRFATDPGLASGEDILKHAQAIVDERDKHEEQELLNKAMGGAASDGLGAIGLPVVIEALERGEVWTLLWPRLRSASEDDERAAAWVCPNCAHLDSGTVTVCSLCGTAMRRYAQPEEALLRQALGRNIEVRMLNHMKLPPPTEIAATLRFLARRNTAEALAT